MYIKQGSSLLNRRGPGFYWLVTNPSETVKPSLGRRPILNCHAVRTSPGQPTAQYRHEHCAVLEYMPQCLAGDHWSERTTVLKLNWVGPTIEITGNIHEGVE